MFLFAAVLLVLPALTFQQGTEITGCTTVPCSLPVSGGASRCPMQCDPEAVSTLPNIASEITSLDLSYNIFTNPVLERRNLTSYGNLESLTLKGCGISSIGYNTFADMTRLKLLDLSSNNIAVVGIGALEGLRLSHLFLDENLNIKLVKSSFLGMSTEVLSLKECDIENVNAGIFKPLQNKMRGILLQGNKIERFDQNMLEVFSHVETARISGNPLICDCQSRWLKEFYDLKKNTTLIRGAQNDEPRCFAPLGLPVVGKFFHQLTIADFPCDTPTLQADVSFTKQKGTLSCVSRGNPLPTVTWFKPNGIKVDSIPQGNMPSNRNEIELLAGEPGVLGKYRCVASNNGGNISLSVNVTWPFQSSDTSGESVDCNSNATPKEVMVTNPPESSDSDSQQDYLKIKYFTLVDMVGAILGTFVSTLVITVVTLHFCVYRRKKAAQYTTPTMSEYSSSSNGSDKNGPYPVSLHSLQASQVQVQAQRPLPNKPYHKIYDENHYMATNIEERDEFLRLSAHQAANGRITPASSSCDTCPACRTMPNSHIS